MNKLLITLKNEEIKNKLIELRDLGINVTDIIQSAILNYETAKEEIFKDL